MATEVRPSRPVAAVLHGQGWSYDIFLLHAGENKPFVEKLYEALCARGVLPFCDSKSLKLGENADDVMEKALVRSSRFIVAIMSHEMKSKPWPEDELKKALDRHQETGTVIVPVFFNIKADTCCDSTNDHFRKISRIVGIEKKDLENEHDFIERTASKLKATVQQSLGEEFVIPTRQPSLASDVVQDSQRSEPARLQNALAGDGDSCSQTRAGGSDGRPMPESTERDAFYPLSGEALQQLEQGQEDQVDAVVKQLSQKAVRKHVAENRKRIAAINKKTEEMRQNWSQSDHPSFSPPSDMSPSSSPQPGSGGGKRRRPDQSLEFSAAGGHYVVQGQQTQVEVHNHYYNSVAGGPVDEDTT